MGEIKKYKVKLNSTEKIETLLQETYDLSCQQYNQIQNEINKIANSTTISQLDIDGKEKYAKAINNYISLQQKALAQKFDIAKLMSDVMKYGGDVNGALSAVKPKETSLNINKLRELAKEASSVTNDEQKYTIR